MSQLFQKKHGNSGNFDSRTNIEMNIYFDGNYEVDGGLGDIVLVEPFEEFEWK